ncbi:2-C-methyl-D-erythritol 4-phosphate cytidylyltransferase [Cellulomonas rhizosphaerae]|uniref:2-C-methyl-D-erythritol 4-phosphate cytidylyltransferase n=1 Tax=Cellulomonas rhizosphaerae TaxID=2293719 RepID=A0A413RLQ7_9CELL|nr:2-C-methyl-D-erythritol 4-phosphate cytidylyltransferase [Cellulomonas rhizosphaerae]RHA40957.1 2-C-methyl-D-erythritol 4-phosphate cytidylyltransferase [Cellulomonas rhizosphaerae]
MTTAAILTAAGSGSRLGHALPKALVPVLGEPVVVHAARRLLAARPGGAPLAALVVSAPADHVDAFRALLGPDVVVVPGGPTRQASVAASLAALPDDGIDVVLVHDAARPFAPADLIERVAAAVRAGHDAVVPGLAVTDTIKRVGAGDDGWPVEATVARGELRAVQTPQGFARATLERAHAAAEQDAGDESVAASDDAGLVERLGLPVWVVPGDERAAKITTPRDLAVAVLLATDTKDL